MKTFLEVELNEFFQNKMDSQMFEGVSEMEKAQFVGRFFRWVKDAFLQKDSMIVIQTPVLGQQQSSSTWHMTDKERRSRRVEAIGDALE